eukprot:4657476-Pleurochrysis_carterae.AAC.1
MEVTTAAHSWIEFVSKNVEEDDVRSVISTLHKNLYPTCPRLTRDYLSAAVSMRVLHVMNQLQQEFPINRRGVCVSHASGSEENPSHVQATCLRTGSTEGLSDSLCLAQKKLYKKKVQSEGFSRYKQW